MLRKFTSRKFILAVASVIAGVCAMFGLEDLAAQLTGAVTALCSAIAYIMSESAVDREALIGKWVDSDVKTESTKIADDDPTTKN